MDEMILLICRRIRAESKLIKNTWTDHQPTPRPYPMEKKLVKCDMIEIRFRHGASKYICFKKFQNKTICEMKILSNTSKSGDSVSLIVF